jgi:hypothetical protein
MSKELSKDKLQFDLIPEEQLEEMVRVMMSGLKKHKKNDWMAGYPWSYYYNALRRHISSFWKGEDFDKESGELHIAHAACCCLILSYYIKNRKEFDDRQIGHTRPGKTQGAGKPIGRLSG